MQHNLQTVMSSSVFNFLSVESLNLHFIIFCVLILWMNKIAKYM